MESTIFTLENIDPILKALEADKNKNRLSKMLYKIPRIRNRSEQFGGNVSGERRFTVDWYKKSDGSLYHHYFPYGSADLYSDSLETCLDYVRNPAYDANSHGIPVDTGSELLSTKVYWHDSKVANVDVWDYTEAVLYRHGFGPVTASTPPVIHDGINIFASNAQVPSMDWNIQSWGPTAFNRFKPAKPTISLANFIGEARDLPRLLKARVEGLKTISDWYLAIQFGWKPLLRDIIDMLNFYERFSKQIDFFYQNAGKPIHRSGTVTTSQYDERIYNKDASDSTTVLYAGLSTTINGRFTEPRYGVSGSHVDCRYEQSIRFAGDFVFWFDGKPPDYIQLAAKLAGLEVTPQVVWNLLPWSWLIDWFSNVGDVIDNLNTEVADRQLARYAYITSKTKRKYTFEGTDGFISASICRSFDSTCRRTVHPFGLSTTASNLTVRQAAILAALGISRSKAINP